MSDCIFCKIIKGEIPSTVVFENENIFCFKDINPTAPFHILIVPKAHISSAAEITTENSSVIAEIFEVSAKLLKENGYSESGYRIVTNIGEDGGQAVPHLHYHVLAGRKLAWPPG